MKVATLTMDQIEVKSCVGGLVKSFERKAAQVGFGWNSDENLA